MSEVKNKIQLIEGVLESGTLTLITGYDDEANLFLMMSMVTAIADGNEFFGRKTSRTKVRLQSLDDGESDLENYITENGFNALFIDSISHLDNIDNQSSGMMLLMDELLRIAKSTNCAIVVKCTQNSKFNFRGAWSIIGICDNVFSVSRKGKSNMFSIESTKFRYGDKFKIDIEYVGN